MATARTTEPLDPAYTTRIPGIPDPEPTITRIIAQELHELAQRREAHRSTGGPMTTSTPPRLARPSVGTLRLRDGEQAVTITAADQRVIVRREHLSVLLDDLTEQEDE